MLVLVGVKGGLDDPQSKYTESALFRNAGVTNIRVHPTHNNLMFVEYDEKRLRCVDIINRMTQIGLSGSVCGC